MGDGTEAISSIVTTTIVGGVALKSMDLLSKTTKIKHKKKKKRR